MPTTEKLKQEIADAEKKLAQERSRLQRLENRKSYYEKGDRKKRAHRLITRGAAVESVAPEVKPLSEQGFYSLAEQIFSMPEVRAAVHAAAQREHDKLLSDAQKELKDLAVTATEKLVLQSDGDAFDQFLDAAERGKSHA